MRRHLSAIFVLGIIFLLFGVSPVSADWPMVAGNPQRTSYTPDEVGGSLHVEWYRVIEPYIPQHVQVIATNGLLYISTARGLITLNATNGATVWRFDTEVPLDNSPTVDNGVVYVGGLDRKLFALNAITGAKIWEFSGAKAGYDTNPVVADGKVMLGNRDGKFYAVNVSNGSLVWSYQTEGPINFSAAYKNGVVYFASMDNRAYALNTSNGSLIWRSNIMGGEGFYSYWPVVYTNPDDGKDYVIFAAADGLRTYLGPGATSLNRLTLCGSYEWCEWKDEYSGNVSGDLATSASPNLSWASGKSVLDYNRLVDYFEEPTAIEAQNDPAGLNRYHHKPWRRFYYIYDTATGQEWSMDTDGDGRREYAPIDPYLSNSGNPYPPVAKGDGFLYMGNHLHDNGISRIMGWRMGTKYFVQTSFFEGAGDEPNALSAGGNLLYKTITCDRQGSWSNPATGASGLLWNYDLYSQAPTHDVMWWWGENKIDNDLVGNYGNLNGVYHCHGNQDPLVPYSGRIYFTAKNAVIAYGTGTARGEVTPHVTANAVTETLNTPSLTDLKTRLEAEVQKVVTAGHLRPGYYNAGQFNGAYEPYPNIVDYFSSPGETLMALSMAYPYLSSGLQTQLKTFLKSEFTNYFVNGPYGNIGWATGANREWTQLYPEIQRDFGNFPKSGTADAYNIYGLWKYVQLVSPEDKTQATQIANSLRNNNSNLGDVYATNRNIAGTVGYNGLTGGSTTVTSCGQFDKDSPWLTYNSGYNKRTLNIARNFMFLVPELGDCFSKNSAIKTAIAEYERVGPYWFVSRYTDSNAESTTQNLYDTPALFQAKAWVLKLPREELTKWLDVPAFKIGDMFYIQNLVAAIEAPSTGGPTTTPAPTPGGIPGDLNQDGKVDILDFRIVLSSFGTTYNIFSLSEVISNFGKPAGPPGSPADWTLTFSDEFNGATVDTTKWATKYAYDSGHGDRSNNDEEEWYVNNAATISSGILNLTAKRECRSTGSDIYAPYNCTTYPYTSGIINSYNRFSQKYGYFEARIKIPAGSGLWPAFWLLPQPSPLPPSEPWPDQYVFWPPEVDIMENKGQEPNIIRMNNIFSSFYPTPGGQSNNWAADYDLWDTGQAGDSTNYTADFHTYGLDWEPGFLTWYLDGVARRTLTAHIPPGSLSPGNMYLILNLAVGGSFAGDPSGTTFPKSLQVDYVRVYQKNGL